MNKNQTDIFLDSVKIGGLTAAAIEPFHIMYSSFTNSLSLKNEILFTFFTFLTSFASNEIYRNVPEHLLSSKTTD